MFTTDITLNTHVYSLSAQRTSSSTRRDSARAVSAPRSLNISHETAKSGRVSSVAYIDDVAVVQVGSSAPATDSIRVLLKLQYNPLSGRETTETDLRAALTDLISFLSESGNVTKLLNQES